MMLRRTSLLILYFCVIGENTVSEEAENNMKYIQNQLKLQSRLGRGGKGGRNLLVDFEDIFLHFLKVDGLTFLPLKRLISEGGGRCKDLIMSAVARLRIIPSSLLLHIKALYLELLF